MVSGLRTVSVPSAVVRPSRTDTLPSAMKRTTDSVVAGADDGPTRPH